MRRMHRIYRVECLPRPLQLASARLPSFQNLSETKRPPVPTQFTPRHFMYAIFAYIGVVWGVNVGIYGIQKSTWGMSNLCQDSNHPTVTSSRSSDAECSGVLCYSSSGDEYLQA